MLNTVLKVIRGIVKLRGATDNTLVGNTGDRLKVDAAISTDILSSLNLDQVYSATIDAVNQVSSGTHNGLIYLRNPSGSGKTIYILEIRCNTVVTNIQSTYGVFANPTVSANGTSLGSVSRSIGGSAPTAVGLATTIPTVTSTGTALAFMGVGQNTNSENLAVQNSIKIAANNSILITGNPTSNNRAASIMVLWVEQ